MKLELFRKIPLYSFAKAWNELGDLRFQPNPVTFSIELKYRLYENSVNSITLADDLLPNDTLVLDGAHT